MANNSVFVTKLSSLTSFRLTQKSKEEEKPIGAPVWSNDGTYLIYNRYVKKEGKQAYLQIFQLQLTHE